MSLTAIRSPSNAALWATCTDRFLTEAASSAPNGQIAHIWLTHRVQRDFLFERAVSRGLRGWLNPPLQFLSALPQLFGIRGNAIGTLTRREIISRIGCAEGKQHGIRIGNIDATTITRGNMLDSFIGELLPEGVTADQLRQTLERLDTDEFGRRRNAWLAEVYAGYLTELDRMGRYDPRSIHALVAKAIDNGGLRAAVNGAQRLHIYGLYSTRARHALLHALARQQDIDVQLYTTSAARDLEQIATSVEDLHGDTVQATVQPAPDSNRELQWVAERVKQLIVEDGARPHQIAVVARTGLHDTRRAMQALERAGVPATARVRTRLSEVAALKALLELFRAAAQHWSYRVLRNVLASPYFRFRIDLRPFDAIACQARPCSLAEWEDQLAGLLRRLQAEEDPDARRLGLRKERVVDDLERFRLLRAELERLDGEKPLGRWIELARRFLTDRAYRFRQRVCDPPDARHDVVRIDQRGVKRFEALLTEWAATDDLEQRMTPLDWFRALRSLLEGQELVLTTPGQKGVQVLEAHDAALAPFRAVFLIHANDGEFPKTTAPGGLFSQEERAQLRGLGLPLEDRKSSLERERVLWAAVTGTPAVSITYRTTDPNGTPLLPSLMVPPHDEESELPRSTGSETAPLNAEQEARNAAARAFDTLSRNGGAQVEAADVGALKRAMLAAYAEARRGAPERVVAQPNAWNGHLRDPAVLDKLAAKYHDDYIWSVSQLQTYTTCPFFFLIERVLGLKAIEEADEDTNALTSGGVAHEVLERFYSEILDQTSPEFDGQRFIDLAAQVFLEWERRHEWLGIRALWEQRRLWLTETLYSFIEWDLDKLPNGASVFKCEYELGKDDEGIELTGEDVNGAATRMVLRGWVDRIDRNKRGELEVIDYKSGQMPSGKTGYEDGAVLQGPVYVHALRSLGHDAVKSMYRSLKFKRNGAALEIDDAQYEEALRIAFTVPKRVRAGLFEAILASSVKQWSSWQPDLAVRRTDAVVQEGSRFDG